MEVSDVDDGDAEAIGGDVKVGQRLLVRWIDIDEDDGLGIVAGDDGAGEELPVRGLVEASEEVVEGWIEAEGGSVAFAGGELKSEDRGEGLHLDQARGERAISIADQAKVGGEEVRVSVLVGGAPAFGDGGEGAREVSGIVDETKGEFGADAGHVIEQGLREEAGSLRDGEGDARARDGVERVAQIAKGLRAEARVEVAAERGNHREG